MKPEEKCNLQYPLKGTVPRSHNQNQNGPNVEHGDRVKDKNKNQDRKININVNSKMNSDENQSKFYVDEQAVFFIRCNQEGAECVIGESNQGKSSDTLEAQKIYGNPIEGIINCPYCYYI